MPHATFATGMYLASYNADGAEAAAVGKGLGPRSLGVVEDVIRWRRTLKADKVVSSLYGSATLDGVLSGAEFYCRFTLKEWSPAVKAMLFPWSEDLGLVGPLGQRMGRYAGELLLTAKEGTLAADNGPTTIRFGKVCVAPDMPIDIPLGPSPRDIEVTLQCLPYQDTSDAWRWFETT